ncbi:MAG: hypothetical protein KBG15_02025 [Kofleriaceae bacterium]|nr:hypothetical protein [Kofleriaceae bacterium]
MSTSKKSAAASPTSPQLGSEAGASASNATESSGSNAKSRDVVKVDFEVYRGGWIGWLVVGAVLGGLMFVKLGTLGQYLGGILMVLAVWNGFKLTMSLLHKPGTIEVNPERVVLPRGLCRGNPLVLAPGDVTAAYFLRNSVPWNRSAPLLIIEANQVAHAYPRDWFASEADQRRIISAVVARTEEPVGYGPERKAAATEPKLPQRMIS